MAVRVFNRIAVFNPRTAEAALGRNGRKIQWAGFENAALGRLAPFAEATRAISTDGVKKTSDSAARGDIRITTAVALTAANVTAINTALDAHDPDVDDAGQAKERTAAAEVATLTASHVAGIADPIVANMARVVLVESGVDV